MRKLLLLVFFLCCGCSAASKGVEGTTFKMTNPAVVVDVNQDYKYAGNIGSTHYQRHDLGGGGTAIDSDVHCFIHGADGFADKVILVQVMDGGNGHFMKSKIRDFKGKARSGSYTAGSIELDYVTYPSKLDSATLDKIKALGLKTYTTYATVSAQTLHPKDARYMVKVHYMETISNSGYKQMMDPDSEGRKWNEKLLERATKDFGVAM